MARNNNNRYKILKGNFEYNISGVRIINSNCNV